MAETIESFVAKLKTEGVEQGRKEADSIVEDAKSESEKIIASAKSEAEKIIAEAKKQGDEILARSNTELELAARDAAMKLRETLAKSLEAVLAGPVDEALNDTEYLRTLLTEIINKYVEADLAGSVDVKLNLSNEQYHALAEWAVKQIRKHARKDGVGVDLKGTLKQAGFEYNLTGATVEMTQESVVELLMTLVGPKLREIFDSAK